MLYGDNTFSMHNRLSNLNLVSMTIFLFFRILTMFSTLKIYYGSDFIAFERVHAQVFFASLKGVKVL